MQVRIALSIVVALLAGCSIDPQSDETVTKSRPAILIEVGQNTDQTYLKFPSAIRGQRGAELAFAVTGVVEKVLIKAAQEVEQDEVLATLDQRDFRSQLNSAYATFKNAEEAHLRAARLLEGNAIARSEVEKRRAERDTAQAQLERAQKALDDTFITAPYAGAISQVSIDVLQTAQAGQPVITLLNTSQLKAAINLPSDFIALSKKYKNEGDDSYIILDVAPEQRIPATFKEISLEADATSQTYEAIFSFTPPDNLIVLPGMNAMVWLRDPSHSLEGDTVSVPLTAISVEQEDKFVWVVDQETMAVSKRKVEVADGVGEYVGIINGLNPGDTIVAAGVSQLSEGVTVRQWEKQ